MSTLQVLRIVTIQVLEAPTTTLQAVKEALQQFVDEYRAEEKRTRVDHCIPLPSGNVLSKRAAFFPREETPPRQTRIRPLRWNTPVSPYTGVPMDGSDGQMHAPLPLNDPPFKYEHYLARNYLENLSFYNSEKGIEIKESTRRHLLSILKGAFEAFGNGN